MDNWTTDTVEITLRQTAALAQAAWGRVCGLVVEIDRRQAWMADGAADLTQWVSAQLGVERATAADLVRVARALVDLPVITGALTAGDLSFDQVKHLVRVATPDNEGWLVEDTRGLSIDQLARRCARARRVSRAEALAGLGRRSLRLQWNLDRSELRLRGELYAELGAIVDEAITTRAAAGPGDPDTGLFGPWERRCADALGELVGADTQVTVTVHTDPATINAGGALGGGGGGGAHLESGAPIAAATLRRLLCDAAVETSGRAVGIGRRSRSVPRWLRRRVLRRDDGCRFPGCGRTRWIHIHHITHWADGGCTDLCNLVTLCGFHHRYLHEHGWTITGHPDRDLIFHRHDGRPYQPGPQPLHPRLRTLLPAPLP